MRLADESALAAEELFLCIDVDAVKGEALVVGGDPRGSASLSFGTTGQPETYVIAPDGVAVCGTIGQSTQAALDAWLQAARTGQECTPVKN